VASGVVRVFCILTHFVNITHKPYRYGLLLGNEICLVSEPIITTGRG
jgi:hypothetical protein